MSHCAPEATLNLGRCLSPDFSSHHSLYDISPYIHVPACKMGSEQKNKVEHITVNASFL